MAIAIILCLVFLALIAGIIVYAVRSYSKVESSYYSEQSEKTIAKNKKLKKQGLIAIILCAVMAVSVLMTGCGGGEKLIPSDITGAQVQEEFWNSDLDASAEFLAGYRAQSLDEVVRNWRQAYMQGNGAILYALFSAELKEIYLTRMKNEFTIWNFYYGKEAEKPIEVTYSTPQAIEDIENMYYSTITTIESDGITTSTYDIYIEMQNGGYFVTSYTSPEVIVQ